ncbi:MAG TPA: hypothetical protein H9768_10740 [Candidatus Mailhella merdavium]|nr:hypothetical protein [Candidatus Mailhella merdavium]
MCQTTFVITLDTDWVPQYVLDVALEQLREYKLPATVFCTSPYVFADDNIEPALHPNFFPGSSHGTTETECLGTVRAMYPLARGSRSHAYYWHSRMYALLTELGLNYDSSMLLPFQSHIIPNRLFGLTRFPVWCSDNILMSMNTDLSVFDPPHMDSPGLKVLLVHPIHIYMNSRDPAETRQKLEGIHLPDAPENALKKLRRAGSGIATLFADMLKKLAARDTAALRDLI